MVAWLSSRLRISGANAHTLVAAAGKLHKLPQLADALTHGRVTLDVLAPIAAVATPETEADLAEAAQHWTPKQARELRRAVQGPSDKDEARSFEQRCLRFNDTGNSIWIRLTRDKYAGVKSTLLARARRHNHPSSADPEYEPLERRLADAFVDLVTEPSRRDGGESFGRAPATVIVHADVSLFEDVPGAGGRSGDGAADRDPHTGAFIQGAGPISAEVARRLACDGNITLSLEAPDGSCLDQKPLRREPTTAQRIEIARRDCGCRFPGCECSSVTDVHHIVHARKNGPTVLSNLITLCTGHHSRVHELGWKMHGDGNALVTFVSPHGQECVSAPSPTWRRTLPKRE
jgi:hypothetical protein